MTAKLNERTSSRDGSTTPVSDPDAFNRYSEHARNAQVRDIKKAVDDLVERVIFEPTVKQNDTFVAWFEAELSTLCAEHRKTIENEMLAFWRRLHPGTYPGIVHAPDADNDQVPF